MYTVVSNEISCPILIARFKNNSSIQKSSPEKNEPQFNIHANVIIYVYV
jgi:hypothetical protein